MANILFHTLLFPPDANSNAYIFADIAQELKKLGHNVKVLTTTPHYNVLDEYIQKQPMMKFKGNWLLKSVYHGIECYHIQVPQIKGNLSIRAKTALRFHYFALRAVFSGYFKADVVIAQSPPLSIGLVNAWIGKLLRARSVYVVQDIFPDGPVLQGRIKNKLLIRLFRILEKAVYKNNNVVIAISNGMIDILKPRVPNKTLLSVIPNFVNTDIYHPLSKDYGFANNLGLKDKFIISYVGNIGNAHDFNPIFDCAEVMKDSQIVFLIIGDGIKRKELEERAKAEGLENIRFLGYQPRELTPVINSISDICLVMLAPHIRSFSFPSKIYTLMGMGKPILMMGDPESDAAKFINKTRSGWVIKSGDSKSFVDLVKTIYYNPEMLKSYGENALKEIEKNYTAGHIGRMYDELIRKVR